MRLPSAGSNMSDLLSNLLGPTQHSYPEWHPSSDTSATPAQCGIQSINGRPDGVCRRYCKYSSPKKLCSRRSS